MSLVIPHGGKQQVFNSFYMLPSVPQKVLCSDKFETPGKEGGEVFLLSESSEPV